MKHILRYFRKYKIRHQFTIVIFLCTIVPVIVLSSILMQNMQDSTFQEQRRDVEMNIDSLVSQTEKASELCNMSTQVFLNTLSLKEHLKKVKNNENIPINQLMLFYNNDIGSMERIVLSNPYLYQIRVFAQSDSMVEMMPILYRMERMQRLEWADGGIVSGTWQFDFPDTLFDQSLSTAPQHIMSLVTRISDKEYGDLGIVEVAIRMTDVFPNLFVQSDEQWDCLIDRDANRYSSTQSIWHEAADEILSAVDLSLESDQFVIKRINGEPVIIACVPLKALGAQYIRVVSLDKIEQIGTAQRNIFWLCLVGVVLLLIAVVDLLVKKVMRRFYNIFKTVNAFSEGDLDAASPNDSEDELGQFSISINHILKKIRVLMHDNVTRELLTKNSEIKALQNQINAHFIYNVLESIKMMAEIDEKFEIADAVNSLGRLLYYSMHWNSQKVTVRQEIDYIKHYIALINLRFDFQITLELDIPTELMEQEIPKMSLQPIVENAVIHGMEELCEDSVLSVSGTSEKNRFTIEISDTGKGMSAEQIDQIEKKISGEVEASGGSGNGIGLKNVQDRIRKMFGPEYGIKIRSEQGSYTSVAVTLPLKKN